MHIEVLVEDGSGAALMEQLIPKFLNPTKHTYTFKVRGYKGAGHIPKNMKRTTDAQKKTLLDKLPAMLLGYAQTPGYDAVIVLVDTDNRNPAEFRRDLEVMYERLTQAPKTAFCMATEEVEAWYLGDRTALLAAYPRANNKVLKRYKQDSVCGTWEVLADALVKGGAEALKKEGFHSIAAFKHECAAQITPHMKPRNNLSPSFNDTLARVQALVD